MRVRVLPEALVPPDVLLAAWLLSVAATSDCCAPVTTDNASLPSLVPAAWLLVAT